MSTTNLNIENIFPTYELVDTVATKASITDAIDVTGASDGDSFVVNGKTVTFVGSITTPGADEVQILRASADGTNRDRVRNAINGVDASNTNISYGTGFTAAEGIDGINASNGSGTVEISLEAEDTGASSLTLTNSTGTVVTAAGLAGSTGTDATGAIKINLSDLDISGNDLTVAEAQDDTGDYRKLIYHIVRKYQDYLQLHEVVSGVTATGGADYSVGDALVFSGGSPTIAASGSVSAVDGNGNPTSFTISGGKGYSSAPTVTITSSTATTTATVTATISDNGPDKLSISKGALTENTSTGIISRDYTISVGFDEAGLTIATD